MASGKIKIAKGPDLETLDAIADTLGVARSTVQVWIAEGMPVMYWGRRVAAFSDEVLAWMKDRAKQKADAKRQRRTAKPAA